MSGKEDFSGMTVDERLFAAGLLDRWDAAVCARDRNEMMGVLKQVDMSDEAATTTDAVLADPRRYGF